MHRLQDRNSVLESQHRLQLRSAEQSIQALRHELLSATAAVSAQRLHTEKKTAETRCCLRAVPKTEACLVLSFGQNARVDSKLQPYRL